MQGNGGKAGDEHDLHGRVHFRGALGKLDAVHAGHDDVGEQQVEVSVLEVLMGFLAITKIDHLVPGAHQGLRQELAQGFVVFDQKDVRHAPLRPDVLNRIIDKP